MAQFDLFQKVLMTEDDIIKFVSNSPNKVIANHLESINHWPMIREKLKILLSKSNLNNKVFISHDGEVIEAIS